MGGNPYPSVPVENLFQLLQDGHRMERPSLARPDVYVITQFIKVGRRSCWFLYIESEHWYSVNIGTVCLLHY